MFTVTFVIHEKDDFDRTEALQYWRDTHGPLAAKIPGVQHYVQQHAVGAPEGEPPFLGVASIRFADKAAFEHAAASPEFAAAIDDLQNFSDASSLPTAFVEEVTIVS
ncbi:EthD family reductase [Gordonia terrae]|uniref:EthD family reductase n=1 Tax=Gordonia terrae TaxID=2055 RepID=UPI003F6D11DA